MKKRRWRTSKPQSAVIKALRFMAAYMEPRPAGNGGHWRIYYLELADMLERGEVILATEDK